MALADDFVNLDGRRTQFLLHQLARQIDALLRDGPGRAIAEKIVARLGDGATAEIVGSLTLAFYRIPTGLKAWIEDVVVAESARGHGVGIALSEAALAEARQREAKDVNLSSRPARDAANQLYLKLGFDVRDTNMYRYKF